MTRLRSLIVLMLVALTGCVALPALAQADGDPGSDVLLDQNLFYGYDDGIALGQELSLDRLLNATASADVPIRVAIVGRAADLGTVTSLWQRPQAYADYLGTELSLAYRGRLLIVMPDGFGVHWQADPAQARRLSAELAPLRPGGGSADDLVAAAVRSVQRIDAAAGIRAAGRAPARAGPGGASSTVVRPRAAGAHRPPAGAHGAPAGAHRPPAGAHRPPAGWFLALLVVLALLYVGWRAGRLGRLREALAGARDSTRARRLRGEHRRVRVRPVALLPTVLLAVVLAALVINHESSVAPTATGATLATNPHLDPGTPVSTGAAAPNFRLTDQTGRTVSLEQYRGKAVILAFVDSECQTICPLTTQAMLDAKAALGRAGSQVQLLGVNANWKSTQIDDVLNYTELHGMSGRWQFATGTSAQLQRVWRAYGVDERALATKADNEIDHVAALYLIDPSGRERVVFTTYPSYSSVPQFGQLLAHDVSAILPSHPVVLTHRSYAEAPQTPPTQRATLPRLGGGSVELGPGRAHLYLFFATWDMQTMAIGADMGELNAYARAARARGLPPITAIDEGSVEPSGRALGRFVSRLPHRLDFPVAIDRSGSVADGYQVQGEPWFVETNAAGRIVWYQEVYTQGWPTSIAALEREVTRSLTARSAPGEGPRTAAALHGSPAPLAALHGEGSKLLAGGQSALDARIRELESNGYSVVLNVWASWCGPCQAEFGLFARASSRFGRRVAFIGADSDDSAADARAFLEQHHLSYPSYATTDTSIDRILVAGLHGTPTTVYLSPKGTVAHVQTGQYRSLGALQNDIETYALG